MLQDSYRCIQVWKSVKTENNKDRKSLIIQTFLFLTCYWAFYDTGMHKLYSWLNCAFYSDVLCFANRLSVRELIQTCLLHLNIVKCLYEFSEMHLCCDLILRDVFLRNSVRPRLDFEWLVCELFLSWVWYSTFLPLFISWLVFSA